MKRRYYSKSGSLIPNPFIDNAEPNDSAVTWAEFGGSLGRVIVRVTKDRPVRHPTMGRIYMFVAYLESDPMRCAYARGPSEAIANLDKLLSI